MPEARRATKPTERSKLNREYAIAVDWLVEASLRSCELSRFPCDDIALKRSEDDVNAALAACNSTRQAVRNYSNQPKMQRKSGHTARVPFLKIGVAAPGG